MPMPTLRIAAALLCALPALLQAAPAPEFRLDAAHRQAAVTLTAEPGTAPSALKLAVSFERIDLRGAARGYVRLIALCPDGGEAWRGTISPYPAVKPGRFLHSLLATGSAAAQCTPDRLLLELVVPKEEEWATAPSIEGTVDIEH